jgi:hypothetical protein
MAEDYLWDALCEHQETIRAAYGRYEDDKPIVLFDIQEQRIYIYPYRDFKNDLSPRNQSSLTHQYEHAVMANQIVVFVRDNDQRRLVSYSIDYELADLDNGWL